MTAPARSCVQCRRPAVAGAQRCLRCGGELRDDSRPVSPFSGRPRRRPIGIMLVVAVAAAFAVGVMLIATGGAPAGGPLILPPSAGNPVGRTPDAVLAATGQPGPAARVPVRIWESCVGRGMLSSPGVAPGVIAGRLRDPWRCDGDGARLRPQQHADLLFGHPITLVSFSVLGFDMTRPCRFVTRLGLSVGQSLYEARLPAHPYPQPMWFAVPPVWASRLTVTVLETSSRDPGCTQTSVAGLAFAGG